MLIFTACNPVCFLLDPVGQYRFSDRGVSDEGEREGKAAYQFVPPAALWGPWPKPKHDIAHP